MERSLTLICCVLVAAVAAGIYPVSAASVETGTPWVGVGPAKIRLISERMGYHNPEAIKVAIHIKLADGWVTYWRAPGEAGIPPHMDWTGSQNLGATREITWPQPKAETAFGRALNVYRQEVVLPVKFSALDRSQPISARLALTIAVCKDVCIPLRTEHALTVPPSREDPPVVQENAELIARFTAQEPTNDPKNSGFLIHGVFLDPGHETGALEVLLESRGGRVPPAVLIETAPGAIPDAAQAMPAEGTKRRFRLTMAGPVKPAQWLGRRVRVTVLEEQAGLEQIWVVGAVLNRSGAFGAGTTAGQTINPVKPTHETWKPLE